MNPLGLKAQLWTAAGAAIALLSLTTWGMWERAGRLEAKATNAYLATQGQVLADSVKSCSAGVDEVKRVSEVALAGLSTALQKVEKAKLPQRHTIERIETVIERQVPAADAGDCNWAWDQIEAAREAAGKKAGAAP